MLYLVHILEACELEHSIEAEMSELLKTGTASRDFGVTRGTVPQLGLKRFQAAANVPSKP